MTPTEAVRGPRENQSPRRQRERILGDLGAFAVGFEGFASEPDQHWVRIVLDFHDLTLDLFRRRRAHRAREDPLEGRLVERAPRTVGEQRGLPPGEIRTALVGC